MSRQGCAATASREGLSTGGWLHEVAWHIGMQTSGWGHRQDECALLDGIWESRGKVRGSRTSRGAHTGKDTVKTWVLHYTGLRGGG